MYGETPLHFVVQHPSLSDVRLLIEQQADVKIKNNAGKTPLDIVEEIIAKDSLDNNQKYEYKKILVYLQIQK